MKLAWNEVKATPEAPQKLQELFRLAHNLAGSGGAFDFTDISIALLDLDNFKQVNDHYGHSTDDKVPMTKYR